MAKMGNKGGQNGCQQQKGQITNTFFAKIKLHM